MSRFLCSLLFSVITQNMLQMANAEDASDHFISAESILEESDLDEQKPLLVDEIRKQYKGQRVVAPTPPSLETLPKNARSSSLLKIEKPSEGPQQDQDERHPISASMATLPAEQETLSVGPPSFTESIERPQQISPPPHTKHNPPLKRTSQQPYEDLPTSEQDRHPPEEPSAKTDPIQSYPQESYLTPPTSSFQERNPPQTLQQMSPPPHTKHNPPLKRTSQQPYEDLPTSEQDRHPPEEPSAKTDPIQSYPQESYLTPPTSSFQERNPPQTLQQMSPPPHTKHNPPLKRTSQQPYEDLPTSEQDRHPPEEPSAKTDPIQSYPQESYLTPPTSSFQERNPPQTLQQMSPPLQTIPQSQFDAPVEQQNPANTTSPPQSLLHPSTVLQPRVSPHAENYDVSAHNQRDSTSASDSFHALLTTPQEMKENFYDQQSSRVGRGDDIC